MSVLLAALAALAAAAGAPGPETAPAPGALAGAHALEVTAPGAPVAHRIAVRIASWGPRPAASAAEARAHRLMARVFRRAGLRAGTQELPVPGRGTSRNTIGVLQTPATCLRIVMAHGDTTPNAPGGERQRVRPRRRGRARRPSGRDRARL